jgi:transcriptional regulator with XRE-family HTH domain
MEPILNMHLKTAILAARKDGRFATQRAVAKRCRIHEARFSAIASGRIVPNLGEQKRIARVLGSTVDHLFGSEVTL